MPWSCWSLFWFVMRYTRWGLEMRAIGGNPQAARRNGIPLKAYLIAIMCLGGAIAGLAGMAQVSGFYGVLLLISPPARASWAS